MKILFVAGTDTAVGKTQIAGALASALRTKGFRTAVMKPVSCGGAEDARFLSACAGSDEPLRYVNPIALKRPLSPNVAAKLEKKAIRLSAVDEAVRYFQKRKYDVLVVEGCGGLLVPIVGKFFVVDLIKRMKAKVLLVSRSGLGTINHTLMSLEALERRGLKATGVIFNRLSGGPLSIPEKTNPGVVRQLSGIPSLGMFPYLRACSSHCAGKAFLKHIALKKIL